MDRASEGGHGDSWPYALVPDEFTYDIRQGSFDMQGHSLGFGQELCVSSYDCLYDDVFPV